MAGKHAEELGRLVTDMLYLTLRAEQADLSLDDAARTSLNNDGLPAPSVDRIPYLAGPKSRNVYLFNIVIASGEGEYSEADYRYDLGMRAAVRQKNLFPEKRLVVTHLTNMRIPKRIQDDLALQGSLCCPFTVSGKEITKGDFEEEGLGALMDYLSELFADCYGKEHPALERMR